MTCDMWHRVGGERSLNILASQLLQFGINSALKILKKKMADVMADIKTISASGLIFLTFWPHVKNLKFCNKIGRISHFWQKHATFNFGLGKIYSMVSQYREETTLI